MGVVAVFVTQATLVEGYVAGALVAAAAIAAIVVFEREFRSSVSPANGNGDVDNHLRDPRDGTS
jgi:hypothetical protein